MLTKLILQAVLACFVIKSAGTLQCYACGFSSSDYDKSCLTITNSSLTVNCAMKYCTIVRQELQDPKGVVISFIRGCEETPAYLNHDVSDPTFRTYYRACTVDLCNTGNGIQGVTGSSLSPYPLNNLTNLLVPGTGRF